MEGQCLHGRLIQLVIFFEKVRAKVEVRSAHEAAESAVQVNHADTPEARFVVSLAICSYQYGIEVRAGRLGQEFRPLGNK